MKFLTITPPLTIIYACVKRTGGRLQITCLLLALLSISGNAVAESNTLSIVNSGDPVPGGDGLFASGFLPPRINSSNRLIFIANLSDTSKGSLSDSGLYSISLGSFGLHPVVPQFLNLKEIVREDDTLVFGNFNYRMDDLSPFSSYRMMNTPQNNLSTLVLQLPVRSGNLTDNSIIVVEDGSGNSDAFNLVAAAGEEVASGNGTYREFNAFTLTGLSVGNEVTFFSALDDTLGGDADNTAIFRYTAEGQEIEIARKGDAAGVNQFTNLASIRTNDFGATIFLGTDDSGIAAQDSALYRASSGSSSFSRIVGEGDTAPTAEVEIRVFSQLSQASINSDEIIGFAAVLQDGNGTSVANDSGLYSVAGNINPPVEIVREGQLTPDGTASFMNFASDITGDVPTPAFNDREQFAFAVNLNLLTNGAQRLGIFRTSESELIEIARQGGIYEDGTWGNFSDPVLNKNGLVAFTANLALGIVIGPEGPIAVTDELLVLTDGRDYVTVAREGQLFGLKELKAIEFSNNLRGASGLNNSGIVVYKASYADGSTSINAWHADPGWRSAANDGNWDDEDNWFLGLLPRAASDVGIDTATDVEVQGPVEQTELNSLSIGNGVGLVRFSMGTGSMATNEGVSIGANGMIIGTGILTGPVNNQGIIDITVNEVFELDGDVINDGLIILAAGSQLILSKAYTGSGAINGPDGLTMFNGVFSPGNSPGLMLIEGDAVFGDEAVTTMELAGLNRGDEFDAIDIGGTLTLSGTLDIVFLDNFSPKAGNSFLLLQAAEIVGDYDVSNLPEIEGLTLQLNKTQTTLNLEVQAAPLPEPAGSSGSSGSLSLLLLSGVYLLAITMRRLSKITAVRVSSNIFLRARVIYRGVLMVIARLIYCRREQF